MPPSLMTMAVVVAAVDQLTGPMRSMAGAVGALQARMEKLKSVGRELLTGGLVVGAGLKPAVDAFSALEDASTRLKVTMMGAGGAISGKFGEINDLAVKLGNRLPGTSADFLNMMATLKQYGISDTSILGGVGEAAANLGVLLKMTPEAAAEFAAKMKKATGTVDKDMLALMDTLQRTYHLGVNASEMMYAFGRSGGALKNFDIQGLDKIKELVPIFASLVPNLSGETVGTGFASLLSSMADGKKMGAINGHLAKFGINLKFFEKGKFVGPEQMVAELDKLRKLDPQQLSTVLKTLTGGGQDGQMLATIISNGLEGYRDMQKRMSEQADMQARVNLQLGTLKNLWDAASGTFVNAMASWAEQVAPELKALTKWFNALSESVGEFAKQHPELAKVLGLLTGGLVGMAVIGGSGALALVGVVNAITMVQRAWQLLNLALLLNPLGVAIALMAAAAFLIIKNWEPIKEFFIMLWDGVKAAFLSPWSTIKDVVSGIVDWLSLQFLRLDSMMPDWMKKYLPGGMIIHKMAASYESSHSENPTASIYRKPLGMAPSLPGVKGGPQKLDAGGVIDVRISDDRVRVQKAESKDPRMEFNVHNGPYMGVSG